MHVMKERELFSAFSTTNRILIQSISGIQTFRSTRLLNTITGIPLSKHKLLLMVVQDVEKIGTWQ